MFSRLLLRQTLTCQILQRNASSCLSHLPRRTLSIPPTTRPKFLQTRMNHSSGLQHPRARLDMEGVETSLEDEEVFSIRERAKSVWPAPPGELPPGWSSAWDSWPYLLSFYWSSPYFLMLPQIDMVVNILHAIPGETRPLMYSTTEGREAFVFTMDSGKDGEPEYYMYDHTDSGVLYKLPSINSEVELLSAMKGPHWDCIVLDKDPEGSDAIKRVLDRDETVIPLLAAKFLSYTPEATHPNEERAFVPHGSSESDVAEDLELAEDEDESENEDEDEDEDEYLELDVTDERERKRLKKRTEAALEALRELAVELEEGKSHDK